MTRRLLFLAFVFAALAPAARAVTPPAMVQLPGLNACISQTGADDARGTAQECVHGSALGGVGEVAASPDGRNLYAVSFKGTLSMISRDPATGALTPLGCISSDGTDGGTGMCTPGRLLAEAIDVVVSPDGNNVYVASEGNPGGVAVFQRDQTTGLLTQLPGTTGCVAETGSGVDCVPGKDIDAPLALAISPDGTSLYAAADRGGVAVLARHSDGSLSQSTAPHSGCITQDGADEDNTANTTACVDGKALREPDDVTVSPNGQQVYVSDFRSPGVAVLQRDTDTGELSQSSGMNGCVSAGGSDGTDQNSCTSAHALDLPGSVLVSSDGAQLYVSTFGSGGLALFDRGSTGDLTQKPGTAGCITEDGSDGMGANNVCAVGRGLVDPFGIEQSPDGSKLYVGSDIRSELADASRSRGIIGSRPHASGGVAFFDRDPATGALQQPAGSGGCVNEVGGPFSPSAADGCAAGIALQGVGSLVTSPDGTNLYAASSDSNAIAEFGPAAQTSAPPRDTTAPDVSRFSISHRVFAVAHRATPVSARVRGTSFRFALSEPAAVKIAIKRATAGRRAGRHCVKPNANRRRPACTRFAAAGTLRRGEQAGKASVKFSGRIGRRALKPGRYRATITATDAAGNVSKARSVSFKIVH